LTGDGVYNLGQVEQTPVLQLLQGTDSAWLAELLHTVAAGDVTSFTQLLERYAVAIQQQPALEHRKQAVQEKLTLLALVHLVFEKDSTERTLPMAEIAARLHVSLDQVEWVVMRAFSVHLLEGSMDQVDQTVQITWVLPRVLTDLQMTDLAGRFGEWAHKVRTTKEYMQEQTTSAFG
jgi:26S proteasome regulatory subunit N9